MLERTNAAIATTFVMVADRDSIFIRSFNNRFVWCAKQGPVKEIPVEIYKQIKLVTTNRYASFYLPLQP